MGLPLAVESGEIVSNSLDLISKISRIEELKKGIDRNIGGHV